MILVDKGVWDHDDKLTLYLYDDSALSSIVMKHRTEESKAPRPVDVPLTTVDKIVDELSLGQVNYIKMDIEGAERQALRGAERTIRRFHPQLAIATENLADDIDVVPAVVNGFGGGYRRQNGACRIAMPPFVVRPEVDCLTTDFWRRDHKPIGTEWRDLKGGSSK